MSAAIEAPEIDLRARMFGDRLAIKILVAAGYVTEAKANEALQIAHGFERGPLAKAEAAGGEAVGDGMLPDALVPHATEWYRLCERRFAVDRITISGELAEAIVEAIAALSAPAVAVEPVATATAEHIAWLHSILRENGHCIDGGKCHHSCKRGEPCFRQDGCVPLTGSRLSDDWTLPPAAGAVPEGWVLVPREPTEAMYAATSEVATYVAYDRFQRDYELMLAAATQEKESQA